jgi:hypothetical protein
VTVSWKQGMCPGMGMDIVLTILGVWLTMGPCCCRKLIPFMPGVKWPMPDLEANGN